jgi:hypothetical protein
MLSRWSRLDSKDQPHRFKLALGLAAAYLGLLVFMLCPVVGFGVSPGVLIPFVAMFLVFLGNLVWVIASLDRPAGLCPKCGYSMTGLMELRCPECGRHFTPEEVGRTLDDLQFDVHLMVRPRPSMTSAGAACSDGGPRRAGGP